MNRAVSTLLLLLVLAGLAGYIYFVDSGSSQPPADYVFGEMGSDEIQEITIRRGDAVARAERDGDDWVLVEPIRAAADRSELSLIGGAIATLQRQRVVSDDVDDFAQFGLDPARIEVAFRKKDDDTVHRLLIGDKIPTGGDLYARLPDGRQVFLVSSFLQQTFDKDAFALRDRTILPFARDQVEGLELTSGSTVLRFTRTDGDWRITAPFAARADYGAVEGAIQRLSSSRMQTVASEDASDLRPYGLDRPRATMTVRTASGPATLLVGRTEDAMLFAKDAARPIVFTVPTSLQSDVIKDASEFRRKDLFDARGFSATRVELRRPDQTLVLEKVPARGDQDETWRDGDGTALDRAKVEELLSRLTFLRANTFDAATHPALQSPILTADIQFGEGKRETVRFARAGSDIVASRADEPGTARLDAASYDELIVALDAPRGLAPPE